MATDRRTAWIDASADAVWDIVTDAPGLSQWFPGVESASMRDNQRIIRLRNGDVVSERIVTCDHELRRLQYQIASGVPVQEHLATIDVIPDGPVRCLIIYGIDVTPDDLAAALGGAVARGLVRLSALAHDRSGGNVA